MGHTGWKGKPTLTSALILLCSQFSLHSKKTSLGDHLLPPVLPHSWFCLLCEERRCLCEKGTGTWVGHRSVVLPGACPPLGFLGSVRPGIRWWVCCWTPPALPSQLPEPSSMPQACEANCQGGCSWPWGTAWKHHGIEHGTVTSRAEQEAFAPPSLPERKMKTNWPTNCLQHCPDGHLWSVKKKIAPNYALFRGSNLSPLHFPNNKLVFHWHFKEKLL